MDPIITPMLIGAGVGGLKDILIDGPRNKKKAIANAEYTRMSPWVNVPLEKMDDKGTFEDMLAGAGFGGKMFLDNKNSKSLASLAGTDQAKADPAVDALPGAETSPADAEVVAAPQAQEYPWSVMGRRRQQVGWRL